MIVRRPLARQIMGLECDYLGGKGERQNREKRWLEGDERVRVMEVQLVGLGRVSFFFFFCLFSVFFLASPPFVLCPPFFITLITQITNY